MRDFIIISLYCIVDERRKEKKGPEAPKQNLIQDTIQSIGFGNAQKGVAEGVQHMISRLCKRCTDVMNWKLKYNKYKKMTEPAKCTFCHQKCVLRTYMRACDPCVEERNVCPKCLEALSDEQVQNKLNEAEQKKKDEEEERQMNEYLKTLKERSRRTVKRLYVKGKITWNNDLQVFQDEQGVAIAVHFRVGFGDNKGGEDSDEEDNEQLEQNSDSEEEGSEKQSQKQKKTNKVDKPMDKQLEEAEKDTKKQSVKKVKKGKQEQEQNEEEQQEQEDEDEEEEQDQNDQDASQEQKQEIKQVKNEEKKKQKLSESELSGQQSQQEQLKDDENSKAKQQQGVDEIVKNEQQGDWQDIQEDDEDIEQVLPKGKPKKTKK